MLSVVGARRRRKSPRRRPPVWLRVVIIAVLLLGVGGLGLLVWAKSPVGQAALLRLGFEGRYSVVQANLEAVLVDVLPVLKALNETDGGFEVDRGTSHDWFAAGTVDSMSAIRCRIVACDPGTSFWEAQAAVVDAIRSVGCRVLWSERLPLPRSASGRSRRSAESSADVLRLDIGVSGRPTHTLVLYHRGGPRPDIEWDAVEPRTAWNLLVDQEGAPTVALVIDDWGNFDNETTAGLLALDVPLTVSVMPGLPFTRRFALVGTELALPENAGLTAGREKPANDRRAASGLRRQRLSRGCPVEVSLGAGPARLLDRRREVWLHLPMEPEGYPEVNPGSNAILAGMSRREIDGILDRALAGLPGVRGVNNHMGSRATADRPTMRRLMASLAGRDLLFLDSLTTSRSVAAEVAGEAGLPVLRNRIFLDQSNVSPQQVLRLLGRLVRSARSTGFAVGIGHPYPETLAVLQNELPRLKAAGVRFVTVSEFLALREAASKN